MIGDINLYEIGRQAKVAAAALSRASTDQKNAALNALADLLIAEESAILAANAIDIENAKAAGLSPAMIDRLSLVGRLKGIADDVRTVAKLPDPVGEYFDQGTLPNGLQVAKRRIPIGVMGVIYESRPNVTIDVVALTLKSGNVAILRGGSETIRSNRALVAVVQRVLAQCGLPADAAQFIDSPDRRYVNELLRLNQYVDLIIPRGGNSLHQLCRDNSTIPVMTGGIGICHLFVDETADQPASLDVIFNAKTQRPTVCNALDTILVHEKVAEVFIPQVINRLRPAGVNFRLDPRAAALLGSRAKAEEGLSLAGPDDWDTEWMSLILGIKVVDGLDEAIDHIGAHSTSHSDGILTRDMANADKFVDVVDSAAVYVNASTRFTDGGQLGLGAEIAVSTQRLHARGPMALRELTTYKWVIRGDYHVRK